MVTGQVSKMMGASVKRKEDPRLITGQGKYTDDVQLRNMAYLAILRSPHAHAHIRRVDATRALQHPDVLAVAIGQQINQQCQTPFPLFAPLPEMKVKDRWPMATDKVTFVGELVAAVVARSREAARDALELIQVDYAPLPAIVDLE
jgi:carbon-monoxide dehydrogenase large subunit